MLILPISLTMAGAAAILNIWLSIRVGRVRTSEKVSVGDGGNEKLIRRMRAHSNYIENTAFVLILIALIELASGTSIYLWAAGGVYLAGRVAHGIGMDGTGPWRMIGTLLTMLIQLGLAIAAIATVYLTPAEMKTHIQQQLVEVPANGS